MGEQKPGIPTEPPDGWYTDAWNVTLVIIFTLLLILLLMWVFGIAVIGATPSPGVSTSLSPSPQNQCKNLIDALSPAILIASTLS
ncbi:MAG: hypothetical protein M1358_23740 [Chloroflexi bacterium]|nr:hypothetical protein [Chloroflexota bacterium]